MDPLPVLVTVHEPHFAEVRKVPGCRRLREIKNADNVSDAQLACSQEAENTQACAVGEGTEELIGRAPDRRCGSHIR